MSEASFETLLNELRIAAPRAPQSLRERVRALPTAHPRRAPRLRPAVFAAAAIAVAVAVGAAVIGGLSGAPRKQNASFAPRARTLQPTTSSGKAFRRQVAPGIAGAPSLTAKSRLQRQNVWIDLRVKDLSGATQSAVRTTRRLGGYVAGADYSTGREAGNSRLALRVPVRNLQKAIARFTQLGAILSQHISVADLQGGLDRLDLRIAALQKRIGKLEGVQLDKAKGTLRRLEHSRAALIREGTYARISLQLTTKKPAAKHVEPGRFGRFWVNSGDILGKEAIAVLYALVVVGPFVLLAALVLLAERLRRRRADHRLLEETG
jgi:Domain of unknown function (DUF4349)